MSDTANSSVSAADASTSGSNKMRHIVSLTLTKTGDAFIDPKLVLTWLLSSLGAPAFIISAVVPIREGGALLPQPFIARWAESHGLRKRFWSLGAATQGAAGLAIAGIAWITSGLLAGVLILLALCMYAFGRAIASTTYKDALARTVEEGERGRVTGMAGSIAAASGLAFGAVMASNLLGDVSLSVVAGAVAIGGAFYLAGAVNFLGLDEPSHKPDQEDQHHGFKHFFRPVREDRDLRRFIIARALLTATALAPPYIVMAAHDADGNSLTTLGPLVIASGLAAIVTSFIWGRLSDRSSRWTLTAGGMVAGAIYLISAILVWNSDGSLTNYTAAGLLFFAQIGYQGVRSGRSIYLTDMTSDDTRLEYTALSNTIIGAVLICGLALGGVAHVFGAGITLALCAALSAAGAVLAFRLKEVSGGAE